VNGVFNRANQKYIDSNSQPLVEAIAFHYEIPGSARNRWIKAITTGWTIGGVQREASGLPILIPASQSNLNSLLFQTTYTNRVAGQPLFNKDPNCHCINPLKDFILNPKAWSEPAAGQFGGSTVYYNDYRQQRLPDEQVSLGRLFKIGEKLDLQVRAEFFNALNRTRFVPFATTFNGVASTAINASATQVVNAQGNAVSGYGIILMGNRDMGQNPRTGQLIARFSW
jgi:hypothetical protein